MREMWIRGRIWWRRFWREHRTWVIRLEFIVLIGGAFVLLSSTRTRNWSDDHQGSITAVATMVAAWVGWLTWRTLRHAVTLSEGEQAARMDATSPVLIVSFTQSQHSSAVYPRLELMEFSVVNAGNGPALDVDMYIDSTKLNYQGWSDPEFPLALAKDREVTVRFDLSDTAPLVSGPFLDETEIPALRAKFAEMGRTSAEGVDRRGWR